MPSVRSLWDEPAIVDPPGPMRRDWALVTLVIPAMILEAILRDSIPGVGLSLAWFPLVALALPWRRIHAAPIAIGLFASLFVLNAVTLATGFVWDGIGTAIFILIFPYALFRWGSGRQAALGFALMVAVGTIAIFDQNTSGSDAIGGFVVLLFPAICGAEIRTLSTARERQIDQARLTERESLARELHDSVAHHVSAIAVQAQAGQAVAEKRPEAALEALAVIEEEASRTLAEMRIIVGALRAEGAAERTPQPGVADLEGLADATAGLTVDVELLGDLSDLRPSVDAALYRVAQESITNASRHARNASRVTLQVDGQPDAVHLTIHDDGDPVSAAIGVGTGYGVTGMAERATLLGGTVHAGPAPGRGWTVAAVLPREAPTAEAAP
jgi:signal transduction histidine kinase